MHDPHIVLESWSSADMELLRLINAPKMMEHLGGPETEEQLQARHKRYLELEGRASGRMFRIVLLPGRATVGSIGYWDSEWNEERIYEIGWSVLPAYQGRGIASAAVAQALVQASRENKHGYMHAFPAIDNPASNAVCRKLQFELLSVCEFEYPPGNKMQCHDWRLELQVETKR